MISRIFRLSKGRWFYGAELIIDTVIVAITYLAGYRIQRPELFPGMTSDVMISIVVISFIAVTMFIVFKPYKCGKKMYMRSMFDLVIALLLIAFAGVIFDFVIKGIGVWRRTIFYATIMQIAIFAVVKYITIKLHVALIKPRDCIIVCDNLNEGVRIAVKLVHSQNHLFNLKYIFKQDAANLRAYLKESIQVFICSSCEPKKKTMLIEHCAVNYIDCAIIPSLRDIIINCGKANNVNDMMILNMAVKMDIESKLVKRLIDIFVSIIGIVVTMPISIFVFIFIVVKEKASPIYTQKRLARDGREFTIFKFRTMVIDAEKHTGAVLAKQDDERITKFGKFLRASRIDELPQLVNVLKGDMAIVGPRPERPDIAKRIMEDLPEFEYRTLVKPGVTGYAQIIGRYDTAFRDKLLLDLYYVNNYSLLLDLRIMFNTIRIIFTPSVTGGVPDQTEIEIDQSVVSKEYDIKHEEDGIVFGRKK